jgi:hypothetical protein
MDEISYKVKKNKGCYNYTVWETSEMDEGVLSFDP